MQNHTIPAPIKFLVAVALAAAIFAGFAAFTATAATAAPTSTMSGATFTATVRCVHLAPHADYPFARDLALRNLGAVDFIGPRAFRDNVGRVLNHKGLVVGYALAEDSDVWNTPGCAARRRR